MDNTCRSSCMLRPRLKYVSPRTAPPIPSTANTIATTVLTFRCRRPETSRWLIRHAPSGGDRVSAFIDPSAPGSHLRHLRVKRLSPNRKELKYDHGRRKRKSNDAATRARDPRSDRHRENALGSAGVLAGIRLNRAIETETGNRNGVRRGETSGTKFIFSSISNTFLLFFSA